MEATYQLSHHTDTKSACSSFGISRSSFYRAMSPEPSVNDIVKKEHALELSQEEKKHILAILHSQRFMDQTPYEIYAALLDEGTYLCSIRTMYRILTEQKEVRERRRGHRVKKYQKPELLATEPNQVWSWDITKLKADTKWSYYYLYVIMDIFSKYVVGWMVAERESAKLAEQLIAETSFKQNIKPGQLTLHADRGSSMKSKTVAQLLTDLNIMKTHNRPYVSNDNPFSESQFKTLKYNNQFPERFGAIQDARAFCQTFFQWYNEEHHHTSIALLTPNVVHYQIHEKVINERNQTLENAFNKKPARFKNTMPKHPKIQNEVWINKPKNDDNDE